MDKFQQILHYYRVDEMSLREIARTTGVDRKTVARVVKAYEECIRENPDGGIDAALKVIRKYKTRDISPKVVKDKVTEAIDKYLKENEHRRSIGLRKQCMKAVDIHRELISSGLNVSYSSVCKYISRKKAAKKERIQEAYLKIHREPGIECEFDWGEVKLEISGKAVAFTMAVFAFPYSKGRRAYLFRHQDSLAFMESHRNFFRDIQGVPWVMVYDNMKVAVILSDDGKKPTETLQRMSTFYKYKFRFCSARAGWEKGNVERSVEFVRRRAFTTRVSFASIGEAQQWLDHICDMLNAEVSSAATVDKRCTYAEEIAALQEYPGEFGCFELAEYKVDKQSTICIRKVHYSVPDNLVGKSILAKLYSEKVVVYDNAHKVVATHQRSYLANDWVLDINHYLDTLTKKPGALEHTEALLQMPPKMQELFRVHFKDSGKDFLKLLKYARDNHHTYEDILEAAAYIRKRGSRRIDADQLIVSLHTMTAGDDVNVTEPSTDQALEIMIGAEDTINQLTDVIIENGAKLPEEDAE